MEDDDRVFSAVTNDAPLLHTIAADYKVCLQSACNITQSESRAVAFSLAIVLGDRKEGPGSQAYQLHTTIRK